jgi:hypothetical protein
MLAEGIEGISTLLRFQTTLIPGKPPHEESPALLAVAWVSKDAKNCLLLVRSSSRTIWQSRANSIRSGSANDITPTSELNRKGSGMKLWWVNQKGVK